MHIGLPSITTSPHSPFPPRGCKVLQSPCKYVCIYVCPLAYLKNHVSKLHEIFCICYLWRWLGPPLTTTQYIWYFPFLWMMSCFHSGTSRAESKTTCLVEVARWHHQLAAGAKCAIPIALFCLENY